MNHEQMGLRLANAWHRAEQGEKFSETHVTFLNLELMQAALSPRRLELLRRLRHHGASSIRALASALGRDYKNVQKRV